MSRVTYINGKYLNHSEALISVNDRSFHFSDAVYEVIAVYNSKLIFWNDHLERLKKSLSLLDIKYDNNLKVLYYKCNQIIKANRLIEGLIYLQISRGIAPRNHNWTDRIKPSLVISALHKDIFKNTRPVSLITSKDIRWKYSHIKSTSLLGNVLLKQKALKQNAFECIMYDEKGLVTEATTSNAWIIKNKKIFTPPLKKNILAGVTRKKIFDAANALNIKSIEKELAINDFKEADCVFLTNSSSLMVKAKKIDSYKLKIDKDNIYNLIYDKLIELIRIE